MSKKGFDAARSGSGTKEWAEVTENIQRGCANNCLYCYAAANAARFHLCSREDWPNEVLTKRALITSYPAREGVVMFPSSHDITAFNVGAYLRVARLILEKGNQLLIVTKPRRAIVSNLMDILAPWREQILFRFTIGALDDRLISLWEPGAPSSLDRLDSLSDAEDRGFARSVSIEPMLAGYDETMRVVENVLAMNPETIWIGKMNKMSLRVVDQSDEVRAAVALLREQQSAPEIMRLHAAIHLVPSIRWKDSIKLVLAEAAGGAE